MKFVGGVLHVTLAVHHVVQITWHVAVLEGNFYLCVAIFACGS